MKNVQITESLFRSLVRYHLIGIYDDEKTIKNELSIKLDAIAKRQIYSKYKTAHTEKEREAARLEYLDKIGVPTEFRW